MRDLRLQFTSQRLAVLPTPVLLELHCWVSASARREQVCLESATLPRDLERHVFYRVGRKPDTFHNFTRHQVQELLGQEREPLLQLFALISAQIVQVVRTLSRELEEVDRAFSSARHVQHLGVLVEVRERNAAIVVQSSFDERLTQISQVPHSELPFHALGETGCQKSLGIA